MIDWDDAFDNSGYVPGSANMAQMWAKDADAFRREIDDRAHLDLRYGGGPRETLDLFMPVGAPKGALIFVHGGYWHKLDKSYFSHFAGGALDRGWAVAVPSYPLAPDVRISDITNSIVKAVVLTCEKISGGLVLAGHSAGGHLVSRMACAGVLPEIVASRLQRVVSISGVHQLGPLIGTKMNDVLHLTPEEAVAESPATCQPVKGVPVSFWVGANERPEFLRQNRLIAEAWSAKGAEVRTHYAPGEHHFNVILPLADPNSALVQELFQ